MTAAGHDERGRVLAASLAPPTRPPQTPRRFVVPSLFAPPDRLVGMPNRTRRRIRTRQPKQNLIFGPSVTVACLPRRGIPRARARRPRDVRPRLARWRTTGSSSSVAPDRRKDPSRKRTTVPPTEVQCGVCGHWKHPRAAKCKTEGCTCECLKMHKGIKKKRQHAAIEAADGDWNPAQHRRVIHQAKFAAECMSKSRAVCTPSSSPARPIRRRHVGRLGKRTVGRERTRRQDRRSGDHLQGTRLPLSPTPRTRTRARASLPPPG